ncbi:MAG: 2' O-ribose methyltransferase [Alyxoria varia]|nr:MAG: 2' O-ribose methyltransferase [Alyxoria varia]
MEGSASERHINDKYRVFKKSGTVVDLGYAPGSWSQVAVNRTSPGGRVVGVDVLPAQPPRGASTIQGDFLSPDIQQEVRAFVSDPDRGRPRPKPTWNAEQSLRSIEEEDDQREHEMSKDTVVGLEEERGYIDMERHTDLESHHEQLRKAADLSEDDMKSMTRAERDNAAGRVVDTVLSDMCDPWEQTAGFGSRSVSDPYRRMMNTSGIPFRDHAGSIDLCTAALSFAYDTLRTGGHLVVKFYQGSEDKLLEKRMKRLFEKVHRDKPEASRSESREDYFIALRRKEPPTKDEVFAE